MITRVTVNSHVIRANKKHGEDAPPIALRRGKTVVYAHEVLVRDRIGNIVGRFVYAPANPLQCGATVWFESETLRLEAHA